MYVSLCMGCKMKEILILKEPEKQINTPDKLFDGIKKINIDYKQENLILFCLSTKKQLIHSEVIFKSGLNACYIDPKTLFRIALQHNSDTIIIAHNHPSGSLTPSIDDTDIFTRIKNCGEILYLKCLDSIIFNKKEFHSMRMG